MKDEDADQNEEEPFLPTENNLKSQPWGLGVRRCSSVGALDNIKVEERAMCLQHPAIVRLKGKQNKSEGYIHQKLQTQMSLPPNFGSTNHVSALNGLKLPGCLKSQQSSTKRLDSSLDDETRSMTSISRVNFCGYQNSLEWDDLYDDPFSDIDEESTQKPCFRNQYGCPNFRGHLRDRFMVILSGLYGILLVVFGLVLPLAEIFIFPFYAFQVFYLYLFTGSMLFLFYVYVFLLHGEDVSISRAVSQLSLRVSRKKKTERIDSTRSMDNTSNCSRLKKRRITFDQKSNHHTGSFYLRLGAMGFGIGSMILDGLYFGQYFDHAQKMNHCDDVMEAIKPAFKFLFTFTQLYFIFQNSKMRIFKYPALARFGLMHMSATNICVWFRVIVVETLNSIHESKHLKTHDRKHVSEGIIHHSLNIVEYNYSNENEDTSSDDQFAKLPELSCQWSESIGKILVTATPYLYPFCIEYSLICAAILYVMWENVAKKENKSDSNYVDELDEGFRKQTHRMSVDCAGSSRGLFLGILFFVFGVISTVAFYVMIDDGKTSHAGYLIANISETIIYLFAIFSVIIASVRMRSLRFISSLKDVLEENLILISLTGLYMFGVFNLIAGCYYFNTPEGLLTLITNITMMIQATMQTIFMFATLRMSASNQTHTKQKPGREFVTFLLLCNFAMWGITTFETRSIAHNSLQLKFYGPEAWAIFEHISVPLGIFYRFHSTVCLSHVWKNAWKKQKRIKDKV